MAAANYAKEKAVQGADLVEAGAVAGASKAVASGLGGAMPILGKAQAAAHNIGDRVNGALDKVKNAFGLKKPDNPVQPCPLHLLCCKASAP